MIKYLKSWAGLKTDRRGVTALEYGLIAGAIIAVIAGTVVEIGPKVKTNFTNVSTSLDNAAANQ